MSGLADCTNSLSAKDILRAATKKGPPFYINVSGLSSYCETYDAIYTALSTPGPYVAAQNTAVCALVDAGYWSGLDWFYDVGSFVETDAVINWVNPGTYNLTKNGTITHVPNVGVTSNGTTGYYNTGLSFGDGGSYNYVQNDAMIGVYIRTNNIETKVPFGTVGTGDCYFYVSAGNATCRINDDSNTSAAHNDFSGLWLLTRNGTAKVLYRNGVALVSTALASTGIENALMYLLAWNNSGPGLYSTNQCSLFFAGKFSTINPVILTNIIETYMDAKGVGVIP